MIIETAGSTSDVVKLLPPLVVDDDAIARALEVLAGSTDAVVDRLGEELRDTATASPAVVVS